MKFEKSAGVVIFRKNREIKYLLLLYGLGHWGFVKGNIEKGEEELETVRREAEEEAGIKDLKFVEGFRESISFFYRRGGELIKKFVTYYLAETKTKRIRLSYEHKDYKWLPYEEALKFLKFENVKNVLEKANEFLKNEKRKTKEKTRKVSK